VPQEQWSDACVLEMEEPAGADVLLVFFAGFRGGFGTLPVFEFRSTVSGVRAHKLFFRDLSELWYQRGVPGVGDSPDAIAARNAACRDRWGAKRVVMVGNSSGGYAAILFGLLTGADEVHAFAPKTRLLESEDFHDQEKLAFLLRHLGADHPNLDLRRLMESGVGARTRVHIHYPTGNAVDTGQARHVASLPNVRLWSYPWRSHALVKKLKEAGLLRPILESAIRGDPWRLRLLVWRGRLALRLAARREARAREGGPGTAARSV
jgi:hypothetical protein